MSKTYPCPNGVEDDCGYPACAHSMQCERAAEERLALTTCSPQRWILCRAFVEVMGERAAVEFKVQSDLPCEGACEHLARKNDEAIARYVVGASMKSGIEVVESYWENAEVSDR